MTRRTPIAVTAALLLLPAATRPQPQARHATEDAFHPCRADGRDDPRLVIALSRAGSGCRATVLPKTKRVCAGDTVRWTVVNTCDVTAFKDILIPDLDRVTASPCSENRVDARAGAATEISCKLKRDIQARVKYSVGTGTRERHRLLVDPELDIRR